MQQFKKIHAKVQRLIKSSGAHVVPFYKVQNTMSKRMLGYSTGAYSSRFDVIAINTLDTYKGTLPWNINVTLLHELIHWTGHEKRLNRKSVTRKIARINTQTYHTEEAIAQYGMYYLAIELGFDKKHYAKVLRAYLKEYPLADRVKARKAAKAATTYLLSLGKDLKLQAA
jgi:antirestriction protein ArdC